MDAKLTKDQQKRRGELQRARAIAREVFGVEHPPADVIGGVFDRVDFSSDKTIGADAAKLFTAVKLAREDCAPNAPTPEDVFLAHDVVLAEDEPEEE